MAEVEGFQPAKALMGFRVWLAYFPRTNPSLVPFVYMGCNTRIGEYKFKRLKGTNNYALYFTTDGLRTAVERRIFFPAVYTKENSEDI